MGKSLKNLLVLLLIILSFSIILSTKVEAAQIKAGETYDVILFWGQSNMVGYDGKYSWERKIDTRKDGIGQKNTTLVSKLTGIRKEILDRTKTLNYVDVDIKEGTAFEYLHGTGTVRDLSKLNSKDYKIGECLVYYPNEKGTKKLLPRKEGDNTAYTLQKSYGTNMIPQFCDQYYKRTGRKVVVVMCALGGQQIANFLPTYKKETYGGTKNVYLFEAMAEKYTAAINYVTNNGGKVGKKLYVVSQARVEDGISKKEFASVKERYNYIKTKYEAVFTEVHESLKELGITIGAIVLTGSTSEYTNTNGEIKNRYEDIKAVCDAQMSLVQRVDIILGSSFQYMNYVPRKEIYESSGYKNSKYTDEKTGEKLSYNTALTRARFSLCYDYNKTVTENNNGNHFTAAALSQIGYEVANNFSKVGKISIIAKPSKLKYKVGNSLNTKGLKLKVLYTNGTTKTITTGFKCTPTKLNTVGTQEITVTYGGKSAKFNVSVIK